MRNRCKKLRGKRTQLDIAKELGITQQGYSFIEKNPMPPKMETCIKLSKIFNKPIDYIFPSIFLSDKTKIICETQNKTTV